MNSSATSTKKDVHSIEDVRALILGDDEKRLEQVVRRQAKESVSEVVSEALLERENKDGSVNRVLVPLVEKSLHRSVEANSDKIVGALYPLVGSLIRKSVSAFLVEFVERTNTLIEHSLSLKSLRWRYKAWRAGLKYADYVASQIYQYQVHQVFVIHRETGTLLHSVSLDPEKSKDGDLVSSMLVAMNDFVADAFSNGNQTDETEIGEIRTDDFTLLIKIGPQAILVTAVTGNIAPRIREQLQITLEDFHRYYQLPLLNYNGDNSPFLSSDSLLQDCLSSALKKPAKEKKRLGVGSLILLALVLLLGYLSFVRMHLSLTASAIAEALPPPGIVLIGNNIEQGKVAISILRDSAADSTQSWLSSLDIDLDNVVIHETPFISQSTDIIRKKVARWITKFPSVTLTTQNNKLALAGELSRPQWQQFTTQYQQITAGALPLPDVSQLTITDSVNINQQDALMAVAKDLATRLSSYVVPFEVNQVAIAEQHATTIGDIAQTINSLHNIAIKLNLDVNIFILGASDNSGTQAKNEIVSQERAQSVKQALIDAGVDPAIMYSKGLGQLNFTQDNSSRMVFIHALLTEKNRREGIRQ
ncbi:OmpA family protein [Alteromonas sp. C1M14]|uniref:OmpA family protein n=1 Tax=Alteromonas sp. C1M14 TaxID=2841567 RepID=UPI001C0832C7|nr:OmpA family protein [Alteromonas sp. C1M14]MBU2976621.1 OmpA family protein [Alteromonas sp. C1M14]